MATSIGKHVKNKTDAKSNEINNCRDVIVSEMHESIKIPKADFTCAEFRKQLDGGAAFDAVNRFLACSQQYEEDGAQTDIISEYLQSSPQCTEILSLLDADKRPPSENKQIFEALTQILLRITDDLSHHASSAVHIVNLLLRAHIRHIYRALNSSNTAKIIMAALKLLVAMVTYSSATAKEVMALFKMDHEGLLLLLGRIDNKRPEDVRVYMVRFLMAFLITNDSNIIEQLLSYRELMKSIFKSFRQDRLSTLQLILPTMQQYIVCNSSISKTQKLKLFNDFTLPQIALLYDWQGVNDVEADDDGKAVVRELVHGFLKEVTCNLKHGIIFHDKSMGTAGKSHNSTLLKFALTQKAVSRDSLVAELVMKILQTCPDILPAYLSKCSLSFTPRNSVVWQNNMAFVMKVYSSLQISTVVTNMKECPSVAKMVAMAMVATVPGFMTQTMINQGLKQGGIVAMTCLDMVLTVLNQAQKIMNTCNRQNIPNKEDFSSSYHLAIQKVLPDVNTVLPVWQKVLLKFKEESSGKETKKDADDNQNTTAPVSNLQLMSKLLEMFCAYQNVLPSSLEQTSHDFTLMVHSVFRHSKPGGQKHGKRPSEDDEESVSMDEEGDSGPEKDLVQLQCHCLKFLMGFPSGRFRWFKEVKGEGTVMSRLLSEMSVLQRHTELYNHLVKLIHKILLETCLFEHAPSEVSVWLDNIMTLNPIQRSEVVTFLQSCLTKTIRNPHPYNDNVADFVAAGQSSRQQSIHGDRATTKVLSVEDISNVYDISIDPTSTETFEMAGSESDWKVLWPDPTLPCSALLPVALEKYVQETSNQSDAISCYISNVTTTILHQQVDPLPLCLLVQHYADLEGKPANDKWRNMIGYIGSWLEGKGKKMKKKPPSDRHIKKLQTDSEPTSTVSSLLQTCFEFGPQSLLHQDLWTCLITRIATMSEDEVIPTIKHVLLYLHTVLDMSAQYKMQGQTQSDFIHRCMKLIKAITDHAIKLNGGTPNQDENTRTILKSSDPKMEDTDDLVKSVMHRSGNLILGQLAETILTHPMFLYWYQHQETRNTPSPVDNPHEVSAIVTGYAVKFLATFRKHLDVESLSKFVSQYAVMTFLDVKRVVDAYQRLMTREGDFEVDVKAEDSSVSDDNDEGDDDEEEEGEEVEEGEGGSDDDSDDDDEEEKNDEGGSDDDDNSNNDIDSTSPSEDMTFDLSIFPFLANFVKPTTISDIVCQFLQQSDVLLPDGKADYFISVICALACSSHEAEPRIGGLLARLLQTTGCEKFGRALLRILSRKGPKEAFFITKEMLVGFLDNPTEIKAQVSASLIEQSLAHRCTFESWCHQTKDSEWSLHDNKVLLLYVVEKYLEKEKFSTTDTTGVATLNLLWDVYWPWLSEGFVEDKLGTGDNSSGMQSHMKTVFCHLCATPKTTSTVVVELLRRILKRCLTEDCLFHGITELPSLRHKLDSHDEITFLALLLQQMTELCKEENNKPELMEEILNQVNHHLKKTENTLSISGCGDFPRIWKEFLRHVLKDEYDHQFFLTMLGSLVLKLYDTTEKRKQLFSLERLYQMIISHSKFLPSMLEEGGDDVKGSLARLLLIIAELEPSVCQTSHFAVFLGAYSATLADHDRCILALMNVYEKHNAVMWEYRPYMWGPVAITQHASRKALGPNLWQQPTMREVLELLDPAKLHQSALNFPLEKELMSTREHNEDGIHYEEEMTECYDPSFLLPLFSHLLAPEAVVDCKKFAECHALEYTLAALGSHNASMRTAAYHILAAYYQHLIGARLMGKRELMYLVECLRNSITEQNCRLPNVVALFIGRVATVMTSPAQHIYPLLVQFLTIKPQVQMNAVPMFHRLFYSTTLKHGRERDWLLQLLLDGLRDAKDFQVYEKTGIFKTLLAFQLSVLCAESLNKQIYQLLEKTCSIPEAAYQLIRQHNLLIWIDSNISANSDMAVIESNVTLLNILTKSVFTSTRGSNSNINKNQSKDAKVQTSPDAGGGDDGDMEDDQDAVVENQFGRRLPAGSCQLIFTICMRMLDNLTRMAIVKPIVVWQYLETLSLACQFQKNLAVDPKLPSHQHWLPLATHHIAQLLFLLGRFLKSSKVLKELALACRESGMDSMAKVASDAARTVAASADGVTGISQTGQNAESTSDGEDGQNGDSHFNKMENDESLLNGKCCHAAVNIISCWRPFPGKTDRSTSSHHTSDGSLRTKDSDVRGISTIQTASNSHDADKSTADNKEFHLFTIKWVLSTMTQVTSVADSDWRDSLQFVTEIVDHSGSVQEQLIRADEELSKEVMKVLLGLYIRNLRATQEDSVNHILLTLVAKMEAGQRSSDRGQEYDLMKAVTTEYKEPIRICKEMLQKQSDGSSKSALPRQLTPLLLQELWSGSPAPQHFWDAWQHSRETKPTTNAKKTSSKRLAEDEDASKSGKKKRKKAKKIQQR